MSLKFVEEKFLEEEVQGFYIDRSWYYVVLHSGRVLNIIRSAPIQPDIRDVSDYCTFLFVEAKEGFFLFRQRIVHNRAQPWICEREFKPDETSGFFDRFYAELKKILAEANTCSPN